MTEKLLWARSHLLLARSARRLPPSAQFLFHFNWHFHFCKQFSICNIFLWCTIALQVSHSLLHTFSVGGSQTGKVYFFKDMVLVLAIWKVLKEWEMTSQYNCMPSRRLCGFLLCLPPPNFYQIKLILATYKWKLALVSCWSHQKRLFTATRAEVEKQRLNTKC